MNEWIDAHEQKPDPGVEVLGVDMSDENFASYDIVVYDDREGVFTLARDELDEVRVDYWTKLPNPPGLSQ